MDNDHGKASRYRERAEEIRTIAASMTDRKAKDMLLRVADDYIEMAAMFDSVTNPKTV